MVRSPASAFLAAIIALGTALPLSAQDSGAATALQARESVERSLPYLEREGLAWIKQRNCLSCHVVTFMLWSHQEAKAKGIGVDPKKLAEWNDWSRKESLAQRVRFKLTDQILASLKDEGMSPETVAKLAHFPTKPGIKEGLNESSFAKELAKALSAEEVSQHQATVMKHALREKGDGGGLDTMSQLLLSGAYGGDGCRETEFVQSTRDRILELQRPDGSWKPGGQLGGLNRTEVEATQSTTLWTLLALDSTGTPDAVSKGLAYLKNAKPGKTMEWLAARTLVERKFGEPELVQGFVKEMLSRQIADGGWAWLQGGASDAFATGQALYALGAVGLSDGPALERARTFLVGTQTGNGSWSMSPASETSPKNTPDRNKRLDPIYRYWGTAWATIGLARTLPAKS